MQPSARQQELERLYNARKGHVPHISISDDDHHVTEAIGSYYDDDHVPTSPVLNGNSRPYSFVASPGNESLGATSRTSKRNGSFFDMSGGTAPPRGSAGRKAEEDRGDAGGGSPKSMTRMGSLGSENGGSNGGSNTPGSPASPASLSPSTEVSFPLNDIDYESSPAAVAQELSNLQAIRRMSMNVDKSDPDLPSFGGVAAKRPDEEDDQSRLFWVPARLHPELAPKEFKTFIEDKVDRIRRRSGDSDTLSVDGLERSGSGSSLRRKKSMLSHQIDTKGDYEDGAERLERKRSKRMSGSDSPEMDLADLEELVNDPAQLMRRMSLDTARRSQDSGVDVPPGDMPMLPPVGQSLKRSTRTTYRRGSLKKGERVPFSKRAQQRQAESESDDNAVQPPVAPGAEEPIMGLTRVQTEPIPPPERSPARDTFPSRTESSLRWREQQQSPRTTDDIPGRSMPEQRASAPPPAAPPEREDTGPSRPQQKQFHSRLASGPGRTTAQLPGYTNTNPLPNIIETLPDGTKVPVAGLINQIPERKSSHELTRPFSRGGAHSRPVPGREHQRSSTLDDISSHPSPLPGSGTTRTDTLTMVPTFEERKTEKKDGTRKSSWKWILGSDDDKDKDKGREERTSIDSTRSSKSSKLTKASGDKARLDVLQNSIDGNVPARGRESLVLNRDDIRLDEERKKESKKVSDSSKNSGGKDSGKDTGLLSAIFGKKKSSSETSLDAHSTKNRDRKHRSRDRDRSPELVQRSLKPDIDYNWTRFSILEERAIYRMAHIKLANPRRALYSQVLLSNFMYSYLAKVQMMHPQGGQQGQQGGQGQQQKGRGKREEDGGGSGREATPAEYREYQRWQQQQQQQQDRDAASEDQSRQHQQQHQQPHPSQSQQPQPASNKRTSLDIATNHGYTQRNPYDTPDEDSNNGGAYDTRSSEEYELEQREYQQQQREYQQQQREYQERQREYQQQQRNGGGMRGGGANANGNGNGYSVAGTHDYLGYPKDQRGFGGGGGLWDDEGGGREEELW